MWPDFSIFDHSDFNIYFFELCWQNFIRTNETTFVRYAICTFHENTFPTYTVIKTWNVTKRFLVIGAINVNSLNRGRATRPDNHQCLVRLLLHYLHKMEMSWRNEVNNKFKRQVEVSKSMECVNLCKRKPLFAGEPNRLGQDSSRVRLWPIHRLQVRRRHPADGLPQRKPFDLQLSHGERKLN